MRFLDFLKSVKSNPFVPEDYYDRDDQEFAEYNTKELAKLRDTRELGLGPVRITDGVAISHDGYFSAVLQVGTVNFALATVDEQEAIIGGYHAVLRQLSGTNYQIKVRMVEADLEPLAKRVDYALSSYTSPHLHRLALQYKQFLREELPKRLVLMERRNYIIASVHSPLLIKMVQAYERETNKPFPLLSGLGSQWREQEQQKDSGSTTYPKRIKGKKSRIKKSAQNTSANSRREQLSRTRAEVEMEGKLYQEVERTLRRLKHELSILVTGLSANGLAVRRLNDWELTALYAEYLRPELAEEVRHSLSAQARVQLRQHQPSDFGMGSGWYSSVARPLSLPQFMGEQSGTVVVSDSLTDSPTYAVGLARTAQALEQGVAVQQAASIKGTTNPNLQKVELPKADNPANLFATNSKSGAGNSCLPISPSRQRQPVLQGKSGDSSQNRSPVPIQKTNSAVLAANEVKAQAGGQIKFAPRTRIPGRQLSDDPNTTGKDS